MYSMNQFTSAAQKVLKTAAAQASETSSPSVESIHLLYGLLAQNDCTASSILKEEGLTTQDLKLIMLKNAPFKKTQDKTAPEFSPRLKLIFDRAFIEAKLYNDAKTGTIHLLIALLKDESGRAVKVLEDLGFDTASILRNIYDFLKKERESTDERQMRTKSASHSAKLSKYTVNLTELALQNKLDPVFGREKELNRIIQILCRRRKSNPCLIGDAGVGKSALAEALAQKIAFGKVPLPLLGKQLLSLDLTAMVAGTKYRGDFEERIKGIVEETAKSSNIILFIDEIHSLVGAGAAEGAIDAANILKPYLARGQIQVLGATTYDEFKKYIAADSALARRFQEVLLNEPSAEDAERILEGISYKYEQFHNVKITGEAIHEAVVKSVRFLPDKKLPDKAVDLIDEASARVSLNAFKRSGANSVSAKLRILDEKMTAAVNALDFDEAFKIRDEKRELEKTNSELFESSDMCPCVTAEDIDEVLADTSGIPLNTLTQSEKEKLKNLSAILHRRVIGQNSAVDALCSAVRRNFSGMRDFSKPIGSFLFLGPTGVGKTELAKALAEAIFSSEKDLLRFDMSEYSESHSVSRLIGSPPGYVGFEQGGLLTQKVRRKPYSVVLFDEIEKAHPDILNILLQILDDGVLTDSRGNQTDFKNTVIIITSNLGKSLWENKKSLGFSFDTGSLNENTDARDTAELKALFRPELLNRIDKVIPFSKLSRDELVMICVKLVQNLSERAFDSGIELDFDSSIYDYIVDKNIKKCSEYGARELTRTIQEELEPLLTEIWFNKEDEAVEKIHCIYSKAENKIIVSKNEVCNSLDTVAI